MKLLLFSLGGAWLASGLGVVIVAIGPCPPGILASNPNCTTPPFVSAVQLTGINFQIVNILKSTMDGVYTLAP